MKHILIEGSSQTGRAALIDRLLESLPASLPLYGYRTVKEPPLPDRRMPIYLYPVTGARTQSEDNLLGWCQNRHAEARPEVFDRHADLIEAAKPDGLLVMDEIGPMESKSPRFCKAVLTALDGETPVLATVRDNDTPFLEVVRTHPNADCMTLTMDNADAVLAWALARLRDAAGRKTQG